MSIKKHFYTPTQRTVTDNVPFTKEQFIELIATQKPKEIWHSEWSSKIPFIIITEYGEGYVMSYCNALAEKDRIPVMKTMEEFYGYFKYQGIDKLYINTPDEATA